MASWSSRGRSARWYARPAARRGVVIKRGERGVSWTIESVLESDVDPAAVFALYADPATWSRWGHNATWARSEGPLVEGGIVDVRAGYGTVYHCRIRRLEPGRALAVLASLEHPGLDEAAKAVRQHRAGDVEVAPEVVEAVQTAERVPEHEHGLAVADDLQGALDGAGLVLLCGLTHRCSSSRGNLQ